MTNTATDTQTYRWVARGFTEDITACDFCGKQDLKGTVRMVSVDQDGDEGDDQYAGVVCAAKRAGRKAAEIRHEAKAADDAAMAAHRAWSEEKSSLTIRLRDEVLAGQGLDIRRGRVPFEVVSAALDAAAVHPVMAAWLAEHPEPRNLAAERWQRRVQS